jgi:hypothetical protein
MASILKVDEMQGVTSAGEITVTGYGGTGTMTMQRGLTVMWAAIKTDQTGIWDSMNQYLCTFIYAVLIDNPIV